MDQSLNLRLPGLRVISRVPPLYGTAEFWRLHLWWPLLAFTLAFSVLEVFSLDRIFAREWFFNVGTAQWLGSGDGEWWARGILHTGGRWVVRGVAAAALVLWMLSLGVVRLRDWRRPAGYVLLSMLLATLLVGSLKTVTNVDCPWDLAGFGGHYP